MHFRLAEIEMLAADVEKSAEVSVSVNALFCSRIKYAWYFL